MAFTMKRKSLLSKAVLLALAGTVVTSGAQAQNVLEEVTVTAQKREENVQDVGIAVTAFTGEQLTQLGYTNAQQVTALAPGVSTIQPNGEANYAIAIRGVANSDFVANVESPVSLYIDEVYLSQMSSAGFQLFDMERVEILRGPQGTLFGRNATGGLAHYITRKPDFETDGYAQITGGEYDQVKFEGAYGGAISENIAGRVSVATHHNSGYIENRILGDDINNANDYSGRGQLLFTPRDDLEILLNVRGSIQQIRTGFFEHVVSNRDGELTPNEPSQVLGYNDNDGDVFAGDYDKFGHQDMHSFGASGTIKWEMSNGMKLTSITDYQEVERDYIEDSDASPIDGLNFYLSTDAEQFSQELRLNGETDRSRWVAGLYYLDIEVNDANGAEFPLALGYDGGATGNPLGFDSPYTTETSSWSIFGQYEYDLTEKITGIAGVRYINESKDHEFTTNIVAFVPGMTERNGNQNIFPDPAFGDVYRGDSEDHMVSAKFQLDFRPNDDWLLYASFNRGVKGTGFNAPFAGDNSFFTDSVMEYDSETLHAYETGFKSSLFGGLARFNATMFYYDYEDFQAFTIVGLTTNMVNSDASSLGAEFEIQATPFDGLDFLFGAAYLDNEVEPPGAQDTVSVQSPKWNVNGLLRYGWDALGGRLAIQSDFQYRSEHYFSLTRAETVTEDGYVVANARISYTDSSERWTMALFVDNITDEEYLVQAFDLSGPNILGMTEHYFGRPRWIGGSVRFQF